MPYFMYNEHYLNMTYHFKGSPVITFFKSNDKMLFIILKKDVGKFVLN